VDLDAPFLVTVVLIRNRMEVDLKVDIPLD
jgi:hypothetical protein